jgi:predicted nucleic acid-binding protein
VILIVDASAAVEYLLKTELGERVAALIDGQRLAAPEILDAEVLAVLRRELLRGKLSASRAEEAVVDLSSWNVERLGHRALLMQAWALRNNVSAYDALYVSAARVFSAGIVTADGPLSKAPGLGATVYNVRIH